MKKTLLFLALFFCLSITAQNTERLYLSGKGLGDTKTWQFYCSDGMNSKKWSKIEVPSQWELQGFGEYCYGRWYTDRSIKNPPMETGIYRTTFQIPSSWKGKQVNIVFEGVMTDTEVFVNGKLAGAIHQGGFNGFSYDISDKIKTGKNNLEVKVSKESADKSVNAAERKADWWIFGGIYRPVYLEVKPAVNIERIAVDAKADGSLFANVFTTELEEGYSLTATITPQKLSSNQLFKKQEQTLKIGTAHELHFKWDNVEVWNTETPNLYELALELKDENNKTVHIYKERIGFRTVEFRVKDGLYVNGTKVVLKGINRHSFHPDGGRTTSKEISLMDGKLIKEMNMNAVRFHYAPDKHFMEVCDSLGIFVVSELAGWQNAYNTETGSILLKELISRDVNHPSVILWSSGNEGGFNYELDPLYYELDPQKRHVIHAWADFDDLDTHHYPTFLTGIARFVNGYKVFMPTEFQHGLYDQGHGAGLEDFWRHYTAHPLFAGAFMWDFSDNAVRRSDKGGILDSDGSNAPDGILGPYRQKEGSYYTVREVWAPIQFQPLYITPSFNGKFLVRNDYLFSNLNTCKMEYKVITAPSPLNKDKNSEVIASGVVDLPAIDPREVGKARMKLPSNFFDGDILEITARDRHDEEICTWTWTIHYAEEYTRQQLAGANYLGKASIREEGKQLTLSAVDVSVSFDTSTGLITEVRNTNGLLSFTNGPIPVGMKARVKEVKSRQEGVKAVFTVYYLGAVDSIRWEMNPSGLLSMHAVTLDKANPGVGFDEAVFEDKISNFGFTFSYPEENVKNMEWFGRGPYRVWKNRIRGANFGVWSKDYNNTITGADFENMVYPEFKGYHGNMYWSTLNTTETPFTIYSENDGVFMRVFTPEEPHDNITSWKANPKFPEGDISFLYEIPAIRCFKPIEQQGPKSQASNIRIKLGDEGVHMKLWFDFRNKTAEPTTTGTAYDYSKLQTEKLDRGVIAIRHSADSVCVSWRYLSSDPIETGFHVYRDGKQLTDKPLFTSTCFFDRYTENQAAVYTVEPVLSESDKPVLSGSYTLPPNAPLGYLSIPLDVPENGVTPSGEQYDYSPNDASIGDIDGDGQYEIILKWDPSNAHDNAHDGYTGNVFFDCYRLDGTKLWRIDLGRNIRAGAHYTQFMVFDLDGDGKAEVVIKTSDATVDGKGKVIGNPNADYRASNGRILTGAEYLTVFNGETGEALHTIDYLPQRGNLMDWGDGYANRSERYLACVAYLDGVRPSVVMCRGYYTRTVLAAFDWDGKELKQRWVFDSDEPQWNSYAGQGNHNLRVADVDGDGCDEIIYGSCAIDHDGKGLYNTRMGHGDAIHLTQFDVSNPGLQVWDCHENKKDGSSFRDAATGEVLFQVKSNTDVGRAMSADIDPTNRGVEMWSSSSGGIRSMNGEVVTPNVKNLSVNMAVWWDGDLLRELLDKNRVSKYNWEKGICEPLAVFEGAQSNNGTKATPCLQGDIIGDWREEVLLRSEDNSSLRLYVSGIPTDYRFHTFLEDPVYRISIATQNVAYNQPTQPGFYFGPDLKTGIFRGYRMK